jgi:LPS sulfotransferase NodH
LVDVDSSARAARLVAILCPERSGSTLLSVMLGAHSRVVAPPELHMFRYESLDAWRAGYPQARDSLRALLAAIGSEAELARLERDCGHCPPADIYRWILARAGAGAFVVDKTPAYARDLGTLHRIERLEPFYVWLIRHPLGVAASAIERARARRRAKNARLSARLKYPLFLARQAVAVWSGREVRAQVAYWVEAHERISSLLEEVPTERQSTVHYERLVRDPAQVLGGLCAALGLELEPAMLDPRSHAARDLAWGIGDEKIKATDGVDPGAADRWRATLDERVLEARARQMMERLHVVCSEADAGDGHST